MPVDRLRRLVRRTVPLAVRVRLRLLRRHLIDRARRTRFATTQGDARANTRGDASAFPHTLCRYERALIRYPGQEAAFPAKRRNIELALASIDGTVVQPGETFSFWRAVGRPTAEAGYANAAALKDGALTEDVGGAICLASTVLYNVALLSGMAIEERRCHSVDNYGNARYFELGRDAGVEYAYIDLRARNRLDVPLLLRAYLDGDAAAGEARTPAPVSLLVDLAVDPPAIIPPPVVVTRDRSLARGAIVVDDEGAPGLRVVMRRTVTIAGGSHTDPPSVSTHIPRPRRERHG